MTTLRLWADGGCAGNPGPMRCSVIARMNGEVMWTRSQDLGHGTSNRAEWSAAILALESALQEPDVTYVVLRMDSQLVVNQLAKWWRVKDAELKPLAARGWDLLRACASKGVTVDVQWVPREDNVDADKLARMS